MREIYAAALLALAGYWLARGIGIPSWRSWEPGDATDIAVCIFVATIILLKRS